MRPGAQGVRGARPAAALLLAALAGACAPVGLDAVREDALAGRGALLAAVPFVPQEAYACGPAALAMVLRYWGAEADAEAIARELALPSARGTLNLELEFHARRRGFQTRAFAGTLDRLRAELRRGRPLIVFQDLAAPVGSRPHFAVAVGFSDRAGVVVLHSGTSAFLPVPFDAFERTWAARRRWTLLLTPPAPPPAPPG
jgi:ABC-type bacteriocin/lantibiotic exporter with double-glycine peptidase domain